MHLSASTLYVEQADILTIIQVGRIIDLTNTWRYYERDEIDELGVEHLKVILLLPVACSIYCSSAALLLLGIVHWDSIRFPNLFVTCRSGVEGEAG